MSDQPTPTRAALDEWLKTAPRAEPGGPTTDEIMKELRGEPEDHGDVKVYIARRTEDNPAFPLPFEKTKCSKCQKEVYVEPTVVGTPVCIYCADENVTIFVELPPDEWGGRSEAKSVGQVRTAKGGEWHKSGVWHDQQWVFNQQD